jgi:hypothetical protein
MIYYLNSFACSHSFFDSRIVIETRAQFVALVSRFYIISVAAAIMRCWYYTRKDIVILGSFSNWMLPLLPRTNLYMVVHNNLDRRFSFLLNRRQLQLLTTCIAQKEMLQFSNYIGHPLPNKNTHFRKMGALLITNSLEIERTVRSVIVDNVVVKGKYGISYLDDLEGRLNEVEYCIIDRGYYYRSSSIIALALANVCKVVLFDEITVENMNITWGISCIKQWENWSDTREIEAHEIRENNMRFKNRLNDILRQEK